MDEFMKQLNMKIKGKQIIGIAKDEEFCDYETIYGLILSDKSTIWILRDAEGNGAGFMLHEK